MCRFHSKKSHLLILSLFLIFLLIVSVSTSSAQESKQNQEIVTIPFFTTPLGAGHYEVSLFLDSLFRNKHDWMRIVTRESQGYVYNLRKLISSPKEWKSLGIQVGTTSLWMAQHQVPPFKEGMGDLDFGVLVNFPTALYAFVTNDPKIRTIHDLAGKRVGLPPPAGSAYAQAKAVLDAGGITEKSRVETMGYAALAGALLDGQLDAIMLFYMMNAVTFEVLPNPIVIELQASNRHFSYVDLTEEVLQKAADNFFVPITKVPNGTLPWQTDELTAYVNYTLMGVSKEMPDEYAYEITKLIIDNLEEIKKGVGMARIMTPEFLPYGHKAEALHPGARRAYEEAGLLK